MPLPVAHSLAGLAVYAALDEDGEMRPSRRLVAAVAVANAPDPDILPGLLLGDPNRFHHGPTHSFLTGLVVAATIAWVAARKGWKWPVVGSWSKGVLATGAVLALLWGSHVGLDILTHDPSPPRGVPALWPVSDARSSFGPLFLRADKLPGRATPVEFAASLMTPHNLWAGLRELLILAPLVAMIRLWRRRRG